jgi:hypothetical protein
MSHLKSVTKSTPAMATTVVDQVKSLVQNAIGSIEQGLQKSATS